jgi:hypothetical protein
MCIWLRKGYVGHRKIGGAWLHHSPMLALVHHRSNSTAPEFLQMVAHNFVVHLLSCVVEELSPTILLFYFSSSAQEVLPLTNLSSPKEKVLTFLLKGLNSPWPL